MPTSGVSHRQGTPSLTAFPPPHERAAPGAHAAAPSSGTRHPAPTQGGTPCECATCWKAKVSGSPPKPRLTVLKISHDEVLLEITERGGTRVQALSVPRAAGDAEGAAEQWT